MLWTLLVGAVEVVGRGMVPGPLLSTSYRQSAAEQAGIGAQHLCEMWSRTSKVAPVQAGAAGDALSCCCSCRYLSH